jgi:hypothetical protein
MTRSELMPFKRHKPEKPGESSANRGGALGSGDLGKSPFGRTAEHPGYRSKKEQARGGTRRDVVRGKIEDVVETATSHREKELKGIAKERQKRLREEQAAQAKQAAAEQRAREKEASQEQKRVNLAQKTAARKEAEAQRKRDRAQARQDERDRKAAVKAANRAARRGRG